MQIIIPQEELYSRIQLFQKKMREKEIDAVLIAERTDLYYFSGTGQQAFLYMQPEGEPLLLVKKDFERARMESNLRKIVPLQNLKQLPSLLREHGYAIPGILAMELDVLAVNEYFYYQKIFGERKIIDCSAIIKQVRMLKTSYEIELFTKTAEKHQQVYKLVADILYEGIKDVDVSAEIEKLSRKQEHMGIIRFRGLNNEMFFASIIAGEEACVPSGYDTPLAGIGISPVFPMGASGKEIKRGEPVILDCGGNYYGYVVDQTRVYAIGKPLEKLLHAHEISIEILAGIRERSKPGTPIAETYNWAYDYAKKAGLEEHFMGYGSNRVTFIGHGVGLELSELPVIIGKGQTVFEEGMVIAVEPKFVFPGLGGVGVEDTLVVTEKGLEPFTEYYPEELKIV